MKAIHRFSTEQSRADLHIHTIESDGALTPVELLLKAKEVGLTTISITDHDSVNAVEEAISFGSEIGIQVIPGVELSVTIENRDVHILAYFFDYKNKPLLEYLDYFRKERYKRAEKIVDRLHSLKIPVPFETVLKKANNGSVGRFHIALALLEHGHVKSYNDAFYKYIGDRGPAFEEKVSLRPEELFSLVNHAGGISFIAHPGKLVNEIVLDSLLKAGVDGIEIIHPSHSPELMNYYRSIASEYFLLESGGSDFHGGQRKDDYAFGTVTIPETMVNTMRNRLFPHSLAV